MLAFESYVRTDRARFVSEVKKIAQDLKTDPNFLMSVMYAESRLNPKAQNTRFPVQGGFATGLIQFTPDTARSLGTSTDQLVKMSGVDQLHFVKKYYLPYRGKLNSYFDVYLVTFFPAALGKPDDWVFETRRLSRASIARSNPIIDINKDGKITIAEFKTYLKNTIPDKFKDLVFQTVNVIKSKPLITILLIVAGTYLISKA